MCSILDGGLVKKYVQYPRWTSGKQICVVSQMEVWEINMCSILDGGLVKKYVQYLRWRSGKEICVVSQMDVW